VGFEEVRELVESKVKCRLVSYIDKDVQGVSPLLFQLACQHII